MDPNNNTGFTVISPQGTTIESLPNIPSGVLDSWKTRGLSWVTANSVSGFPKALVPQSWKDFGPRLAAAYRISDKWVVRGGYGIYYWPMPLSQILQASRSNPPLNLRFENTVADHGGTIPNYDLLYAPAASDFLPNATVNVYGVQSIPTTSRSFFGFDPHNWADDRMQQWTFTVERELVKNMPLRLSYIGTHGSNLEQLTAWNNPESAYNYEVRTGLLGFSPGSVRSRRPSRWNGRFESHVDIRIHSVQAQVERRFRAD
jgi:hypothetical protein